MPHAAHTREEFCPMEKLNKQMDDALNTKVAALNATDDEPVTARWTPWT